MHFTTTILLSVSAFASVNGNVEKWENPHNIDIQRLLQIPNKKISKTMDLKQKQKTNIFHDMSSLPPPEKQSVVKDFASKLVSTHFHTAAKSISLGTKATNSGRHLIGDVCMDDQIEIEEVTGGAFDAAFESQELQQYCETDYDSPFMTSSCDLYYSTLFDGAIEGCEEEGGSIVYLDMATSCEDLYVDIFFIPTCLAPACDANEFIEFTRETFNADENASGCEYTLTASVFEEPSPYYEGEEDYYEGGDDNLGELAFNEISQCEVDQMELEAGITQPSQILDTYYGDNIPEGCVVSTDDESMSIACNFLSSSIFDESVKECRDAGAKVIYLEVDISCETISQYMNFYPYCLSESCDTDYQVEKIQIEASESLEEYYSCENIEVGATLEISPSDEPFDPSTETCYADENLADLIGDYLSDTFDDDYYPPGCAIDDTSIVCDFTDAQAFNETESSCAQGKIIYLNMYIGCEETKQLFTNLPFCLGASCEGDVFAETLSDDLVKQFEDYYTCDSVDVSASDSITPVLPEVPEEAPKGGRGESRGSTLDYLLSTSLVLLTITVLQLF